MQQTDVLIAGGGLAGLTSAIHLARQGLSVTLIGKDTYPHHKVCGEYISNEVLPYLQYLDADPAALLPAQISELEYTTVSGRRLEAKLPLGGFGLSRFLFDRFLYEKALQSGSTVITGQVTGIDGAPGRFEVSTQSGLAFHAKLVLGAFGKRSNLDVMLKRDFIQQRSPWLAVKGHYTGVHPSARVGLHHFDGGYCGVSMVEQDILNICYLVRYESFKRFKHIEEHREQVLYRNPFLKKILQQAKPLFARPMTISQVSFERKKAVERHILMMGDTAGLIHPFCGNGMAMAIHSARIASDLVLRFFRKEIDDTQLERLYTQQWNSMFGPRLRTGRQVAAILHHEKWASLLTRVMGMFPALLPLLIRSTHGKPIKTDNHARQYPV